MRKQTVILSFKEWGNQSVQLRGVGKQNYVHLRSEDMDANTATYIYCRKREWEVGGSPFFFFFFFLKPVHVQFRGTYPV